MSRAVRTGAAAAVLALACIGLTRPLPVRADPSGIGNASVFWIAVSPAYTHSGLVLAMATPFQGCSGTCTELWASHDGGNSWARSPAAGWNEGRPVIAVDGRGHEVVLASAGGDTRRSDDEGTTWHVVGGAGALPAFSPGFARDASVGVASGGASDDYMLRGGASSRVNGSGGSLVDFQFAFSPAYPSGGSFSPALLSAADPNSHLPVLQRCDAALSCSGSTQLPGAVNFSAPVTLYAAGDYGATGVVFAQSGRGVYKSVDGGTSFAPLTIFNGEDSGTTATPSVALAPGYQERGAVRTLFASVFAVHVDVNDPRSSGGVYRSDDGGLTWRRVGSPSPLDVGSTAVAVAPDGRLFAGYMGTDSSEGTRGGLLCSTNGGTSWQAACPAVGDGAAPARAGGAKRAATSSQQGGPTGQAGLVAGCPAGSCATPVAPAGAARVAGADGSAGTRNPVSGVVAAAAVGLVGAGLGAGAFLLYRRRRTAA